MARQGKLPPNIDRKMPKGASFFKEKPLRSVGLDIGTYNLKIIELEKKGDNYQIVGMGMKPITESQDIAEEIKKAYDDAHISTKAVNVSVAGENVVARYLTLPKMSHQEIKKAIEFQLVDHIPFKQDEIYLDYEILGDKLADQNNSRVFLVACKKDFMDAKIDLIQKAGLHPQTVTMDVLALKNTLYHNYPEEKNSNTSILNIGNKLSNLIIAQRGIPCFIRDAHFGGDMLTHLLQTRLGLNRSAAEELKHSLHKASPEAVQIVKSASMNLLNEISIAMDFFEDLTGQKAEKIFLSAGSSQMVFLKDYWADFLPFPITTLEPFKNFSFSSDALKADAASLAPYFAVAIGLALESFS
jgi:type IV pilus assembly protein PilM